MSFAQQMPYSTVDNYAPTSGAYTFSAPYGMVAPTNTATPVTISQTAQINFVAGTRLALHPGFSAGSFTGNGYFHGQIGVASDFDVVFIEPNQNTPYVGQFEKLEIGLNLPSSINQLVSDFIANGTGGINPFDPEEISVEAVFTNGINQYTVYGFYFEDFIRDPNAMTPFSPAVWIRQPTGYNWRIRFAPPKTGNWNCAVSIRLNNASTFSYAVNNLFFECLPSSNQGWLKKGNDNWHLKYSGSNNSFFALGQNITHTDGSYFRGGYPLNFNRLYSGGFLDVIDWIGELGDAGGNMVRIGNSPVSWEIEYEHINNYSGRLPNAWELDQIFEMCEQNGMQISYDIHFFGTSTDANAPAYFRWDDNPYHTQLTSINTPDDFLTETEAKKVYKKKIRYILSRWGYSTSLGILFVSGEIDTWEFVNDDATVDYEFKLWFSEMILYSKSLMSYRDLLMSTSYKSGTFPRLHEHGPFEIPSLDITSLHLYNAERSANIKERFNEVNNQVFLKGTHGLWPDKPTFFQELGLPDHYPADGNDIEGCSDINFHNTLWSTAFMGGFGTGFPWWQWFNSGYRSANYPALSSFFNGVDFENVEFKNPGVWDDAPLLDFDHSNSHIETFYITDNSGKRAMGWIHNTSYWWGNTDLDCTDRNNIAMDLPDDDDEYTSSPQSLGNYHIVEVKGLNNLKTYTIDYYNTRGSGGQFNSLTKQSNIFGVLKPTWIDNPPDLAFKAYRSGNNFRTNEEILSDTLFCWQDTIYAQGNHENDSIGKCNYHWYFGNGQQSYNKNDIVIYDQPGTYLVTLIVSDSLGWVDTLQQYIVKPQPCISSKLASDYEINTNVTWDVYPNPASTLLTVFFDSSWAPIVIAELYSLDGKCHFRKFLMSQQTTNIPLEYLSPGFYILRITDDIQTRSKRIIIVN